MPTHLNTTNLRQSNPAPECQISSRLGAEDWTGYGAAPAKCERPISPSLILWFVSHQGEMNNGLSSGITSTIAVGDFWDDVCNGLISTGLNHAMHLVVEGGKWVYHLHKFLSVPKQIGDMDCKYAVMEGIARFFGESKMTQSEFKTIGESFLRSNPNLTLTELFRLCGFSVSEPGSVSIQTLLDQMEYQGFPVGIRYMPNKDSDHIGVMTAFGIDNSRNCMIQLSDPYYGDNHIIPATCDGLLYYQFSGYQSIPDMLNEPIKCLHYY